MHRLQHQLEDLKQKEVFGAGALQVTHKEWQPLETQLRKINELVGRAFYNKLKLLAIGSFPSL